MDKGTQSLLNILLSVLAPVMVLDHCSVSGPELWQLGTTAAMCVALSLPLGFGVWTFAQSRKVEPLTLFGLLGTILTGVVTIYANTGSRKQRERMKLPTAETTSESPRKRLERQSRAS